MPQHILVVTSTFPASDADPIPAFVRDQIVALKRAYPHLLFSVLAPHHAYGNVEVLKELVGVNEQYHEYRFHYFWPFRFEQLTWRGIIPTLKQKPVYHVLIPFLIVAEFFALLKLTRRLKPDIIYAHWFTPQGITAGLVSEITRTPFVYTSHSSDVAIMHKIPVFGPSIVRRFSKKAQAITVVSRRSLEKLQNFFTDQQWDEIRKKVAIIPMGVAVNIVTELTKVSRINQQNILFIGRLVEKKGVHYLLPAFAAIREKYPRITLTIAGDGPWLTRLQNQAKELNILNDGVIFAGYVSGDAKAKVIADADIFVVPSIITEDGDAEGLPVALMEGLAAGKICIATNESGAEEILEGEVNGFLVPQKSADALTVALDKCLQLTSETRSIMRDNALKIASQFAWTEIAKLYYQALFEQQAS